MTSGGEYKLFVNKRSVYMTIINKNVWGVPQSDRSRLNSHVVSGSERKVSLSRLDICKPTRLHQSFLLYYNSTIIIIIHAFITRAHATWALVVTRLHGKSVDGLFEKNEFSYGV